MSPPLLDVVGLSKSFGGVQAVRDVSFTVECGELVALIGPNGAGKSTCFNMLNGQVRPDGGTIRLSGRNTTGLPPSETGRLGIGRTFQVAATFASMTVRENVQVALLSRRGALGRIGRHAGRRCVAEADALLRLVGMEDAAEGTCGVQAYGDGKRLELAMALANAPSLLLMDEPTAGMGPAERTALMRLTVDVARERGIGVVFTEHDMDAVFDHADRVLVLERGRLVAAGPPDAVRRDPLVRAIYLGGAP